MDSLNISFLAQTESGDGWGDFETSENAAINRIWREALVRRQEDRTESRKCDGFVQSPNETCKQAETERQTFE